MTDIYGAHRAQLLEAATEDTLKWLVGPDETAGTKPSDQFWIRAFAGDAGPFAPDDAHRFLVTFVLTIMTQWDREKVAQAIDAFRETADFDPATHIPALAEALREANEPGNRQTSAASKIANFAFLSAEVYIWDSLAMRSVRLRETLAGRKRESYTSGREHRYHAYHTACRRAFEREMGQDDFLQKVRIVIDQVRTIDGPLSDPTVPDSFFQRRLLDKLMFHEGALLREAGRRKPRNGSV
jgi:hypothetical protein